MKIVFLDIDGVLVNRNSLWNSSARQAVADQKCVAALNRILTNTGALIVVSSSWRIGMNLVELREMLKEWGVVGKVLDKTPVHGGGDNRGDEIAAWLAEYEKFRDKPESFVILDDDSDMNGLSPFLVRTLFATGLTEADADKAIESLAKGGGSHGE